MLCVILSPSTTPLVTLILGPLVLRPKDSGLKAQGLWHLVLYPVPFVPGPKPWVLEPQDQGDQGPVGPGQVLTVQDSAKNLVLQ